MKTLKDHSEAEILKMTEAEFEAVVDYTVDQLIEHLRNSSKEQNERWHAENPDAAAWLERWKLEHPEAHAAKERAGERIRAEARRSARECLISGWADKRQQHQAGTAS